MSTQILMAAVQAGLQLYGVTRQSYIDNTLNRGMALPLPDAPAEIEIFTLQDFFLDTPQGQAMMNASETYVVPADNGDYKEQVVPKYPFLKGMKDKLEIGTLNAKEKDALTKLYVAFDANGEYKDSDMPDGKLVDAVLTVEQWAESEDTGRRSLLQQIAGTLVNTAVDYFAGTPGAISEDRPQGRALRAFLTAIDDVDFAGTPVRHLAGNLMVAVLDGVSASPELMTGGEKEQLFVQNITRTLAHSTNHYLSTNPTAAERRSAGEWVGAIGRALLKGGADTVMQNPATFFGVKAGAESEALTTVGSALTGLIMDENFTVGQSRLNFKGLFSGAGIDTLTRSMLTAVSENPELLKIKEAGFRQIVLDTASSLGQQEGVVQSGIFSETLRLVFEKTAANMELVWENTDPPDPKKNLLIKASQEMLYAISALPENGKWKPTLNTSHFVQMTESVFDEVLDNPDWVLNEAGVQETYLRGAVTAVADSLNRVNVPKVSTGIGVTAMQAGINAAGKQQALLSPISGKVALTAVLDTIFGTIFPPGISASGLHGWGIKRQSSIKALIEISLDKLSSVAVSQQHIDVLNMQLGRLMSNNISLDQFGWELEASLI